MSNSDAEMSDGGTVIPFARPPAPAEPETPHLAGKAMCPACRHGWVAVATTGTVTLECPACGFLRGAFVGEVMRGDPHYVCNCRNMYFAITPDRIYCPNCGLDQAPFDKVAG